MVPVVHDKSHYSDKYHAQISLDPAPKTVHTRVMKRQHLKKLLRLVRLIDKASNLAAELDVELPNGALVDSMLVGIADDVELYISAMTQEDK